MDYTLSRGRGLPPSNKNSPAADVNEVGDPTQDISGPHKVYGALEYERLLYILTGCGVGPWYLCLLRTYWEHPTMVEKAGIYPHHPPLQRIQGGDTWQPPLPHNLQCIF